MIKQLTPSEERLVIAAYGSPQRALPAWEIWRDEVDWDGHLTGPQFRLLPPLFHHLESLGVDDPLLNKFRGVSRQAWLRNQRRIHGLQPLFSALQDAGAALIVAGDLANTIRISDWHMDEGAPLDLLVPADCVLTVAATLRKLGLIPAANLPNSWLPGYLVTQDGATWITPQGRRLRIGWKTKPLSADPCHQAEVWQRALPISQFEIPAALLDPTDQLLGICARLRSEDSPQLLWYVGDIMALLRQGEEAIDWDRFAQEAEFLWLQPHAADLLTALAALLPDAVPSAVLDTIQQQTGAEQPRAEPTGIKGGRIKRARHDWRRYTELLQGEVSSADRVLAFPGYLMGRWGLFRARQLPRRIYHSVKHTVR